MEVQRNLVYAGQVETYDSKFLHEWVVIPENEEEIVWGEDTGNSRTLWYKRNIAKYPSIGSMYKATFEDEDFGSVHHLTYHDYIGMLDNVTLRTQFAAKDRSVKLSKQRIRKIKLQGREAELDIAIKTLQIAYKTMARSNRFAFLLWVSDQITK